MSLFFNGALLFLLLSELDDGSRESIEDRLRFWARAEASEVEHSSRALLNAGGATNTFGILHGLAFVGKVHDIDSLVADRGADVTRDAFVLIGKDAELTECALVDLHESRERASEAAPDTTR